MLLGEFNKLDVTRKVGANYILTNDKQEEAILFARELEEELVPGDTVEAFVFSDADFPFIATLKKPKINLHEFAYLKVNSVNKFGAFLDWGLAKDLFVPFSSQKLRMEEGKSYLVYLDLDEVSGRLVGSGKINQFYTTEGHDLEPKDEIELLIADKSILGYNVIINRKYSALLFESEIIRPVRTGDVLTAYVKSIREDGKIDVRLRKPGHFEVNDAESNLIEILNKSKGYLNLTDKSDPDEIRNKLQMSKKTFKMAVGALYKKRVIRIENDGIYLVEEGNN